MLPLSSRRRPYSSQKTALGRSSCLGGTIGGWSDGATGLMVTGGFGLATIPIAEGVTAELNLVNSSLGLLIALGSLSELIFFLLIYYLF